MTKFHINKHGVPAPCKAESGNCPLGGDDQHFKTQKDAQTYADKVNSDKYSILPKVDEESIDIRYLPFYDEVLKHKSFDEFASHKAQDIVKSKVFNRDTIYEDSLKMWKDVHYHNSSKNLCKISDEEAIQVIIDNVRPSALSGWFREYNSAYKPGIEQEIITNPELRNASLNIAHRVYQESTGKQIDFDDFLESEITVYRGGNFDFVEKDVFVSYSFDKRVADKFAGTKKNTVSKKVKIKDTLGSLQTTGEAELMVRRV